MDWFFSSVWELFESYVSFGLGSIFSYLLMAVLTFFIFGITGIAGQCRRMGKDIKDISDDTFQETILQSFWIGLIWPFAHLIVGVWLIFVAGAALLIYPLRFLKKFVNRIPDAKPVS